MRTHLYSFHPSHAEILAKEMLAEATSDDLEKVMEDTARPARRSLDIPRPEDAVF